MVTERERGQLVAQGSESSENPRPGTNSDDMRAERHMRRRGNWVPPPHVVAMESGLV
jgi:hypothetical protein